MARGRIWWLALLVASCATRQASPQLVAELAAADALVHDGCYECLQRALAVYDRATGVRNAPPGAARGGFSVSVLLATRAKELGLPSEPAVELVRAWAAKVPAPRPPLADLAPDAYIAALQLVTGEITGLTPEEREERSRARRAAAPDGAPPPARVALSAAIKTDIVAQYLALAIDCEDARARNSVSPDAIVQRFPQPLIRFRLALCGIPNVRVDPLRAADARWVDTLFFEGRAEMTRFPAPDVGRAAELFEAAHTAFPSSTAMTLALGNARNALEEHAVALALFDSILESQRTHRDALLGRLLSLSYLRRHYDAMRTATTMVELGTYHIGDAYYWRAWNRYQVHELPAAWTDVEAATKLMVNTAVFTLAGFIAYAQRDLDTAIDRLDRAFRMDRSNCEAVWTEGMVHVDKQDWSNAATRFTTAVTCFADDARAARGEIATAERAAWTESVKTRRIATARKRAETSEHRHAQAAFNAASGYVRLGRKAEALRHVDIAATHPLLKDKAAALRGTIEKLR